MGMRSGNIANSLSTILKNEKIIYLIKTIFSVVFLLIEIISLNFFCFPNFWGLLSLVNRFISFLCINKFQSISLE